MEELNLSHVCDVAGLTKSRATKNMVKLLNYLNSKQDYEILEYDEMISIIYCGGNETDSISKTTWEGYKKELYSHFKLLLQMTRGLQPERPAMKVREPVINKKTGKSSIRIVGFKIMTDSEQDKEYVARNEVANDKQIIGRTDSKELRIHDEHKSGQISISQRDKALLENKITKAGVSGLPKKKLFELGRALKGVKQLADPCAKERQEIINKHDAGDISTRMRNILMSKLCKD